MFHSHKNILKLLALFVSLGLLFPALTSAATTTITSSQSSISDTDEYTVDVTLSSSVADGTVYYLRGEFYKPGTTQYCGSTWNGTSFFAGPFTGNGFTNLQSVTLNGGTWIGQLKAKFDSNSSACNQSGTYNFRVLRYTAGGSTNTDSQTPLSVVVTIGVTPSPTASSTPTASVIPTVIPTSSPTSTPSPTPSETSDPTNTPEPTPTSTVSPTPTATATVTPSPTNSPTASPTPSPTEKPEEHNHEDTHWRFDRFSDFHFGRYHCHIEYIRIKHRWFVTFAPQFVCSYGR